MGAARRVPLRPRRPPMAADHEEDSLHPERARGRGSDVWEIARRWGRRVAFVDLQGAGRSVELDERLAAHARLSGAALALAPFAARAADPATPVFTLAVGEAVGRGVPTAARVTVAARAPLRSGVTEAQCGGPFASDLAALLDGLVISGRAQEPVHLVVGGEGVRARRGTARTASLSARTREALEHGGAALVVGPAADAGLPFANIASVGGAGAPSFVGRGGLGKALRGAGVLSIVVETRDESGAVAEGQLAAALGRSPRLLERARGGTLELAAHRGTARVERGEGAARHGCRGCPTPCGWVLQLEEEGAPRRAMGRFAAMQGFAASGEAGRCLDRCNELGVDARSAARLVRDLGRETELPGVLEELVESGLPAHAAALALGPSGDEEPAEVVHAADLAARVGVIASPRGPEPMRSLSIFGLAPGADLPGMALTGDAAADAGRLARWHGAFASAVDISGFCAFSAAALVADGILGIEELARAISPSGGWDGHGDDGAAAMLAAGERHLQLHQALGGGSGRRARTDTDDESLRRALEAHDRGLQRAEQVPPPAAATTPGSSDEETPEVSVSARGKLGSRLGGREHEAVTVAGRGTTVLELLRDLASRHPHAASLLLSEADRPIPAVLRSGEALAPGSPLAAGDSIELVLVIPGG